MTVSLRYADLISTLPSGVSVLAWPMHQSKKSSETIPLSQKGNGVGSHPIPARLTYAEDALRTMSLPEGFASLSEFHLCYFTYYMFVQCIFCVNLLEELLNIFPLRGNVRLSHEKASGDYICLYTF